MSTHVLSWRHDLENKKFLYEQATPFRYMSHSKIPDQVDPRGKIRIMDQGQIGSCSGCSRAGCMEDLANGIGNQGIEFSEMFAYLTGQAVDDLLGQDVGATISGGIKASKDHGNSPRDLFPYPNRYMVDIPQQCYPEAEKHQLLAHSQVHSAKEARQAIGSGFPIYLGIMWGQEMDRAVVDRYSGNGIGGHSVRINGYVGDYFLIPNSWGEGWGDRGWAKWHMRAVDQMIKHSNSEFFAVSEIEDPEPREWNYETDLILG